MDMSGLLRIDFQCRPIPTERAKLEATHDFVGHKDRHEHEEDQNPNQWAPVEARNPARNPGGDGERNGHPHTDQSEDKKSCHYVTFLQTNKLLAKF